MTFGSIWKVAKLREKLVIIIGLIYVLSPLDLIPEIILGPLGLLDDGGALLAVIAALWSATKRYQSTKRTVIEGKEVV